MIDRAVESKIVQALAEYLKRDPATITDQHHLRDDLGLDSMAVIELLYKIEETFNLQIPDEDLVALSTVGSVALYVQKRLTPAAVASPHPTKKSARSRGPSSTKAPSKKRKGSS